jgi:hypothetical protein
LSRTSRISTPSSHLFEPEPIFDAEKIAELLELVEHMKTAWKKEATEGDKEATEGEEK